MMRAGDTSQSVSKSAPVGAPAPAPAPADWENVYIFISSTFNDMHAERDFLVKRVFPELSVWCEERRLRLVDIDLRWGVTEEDSEHNKRVVEVCLRNIDRCRPFFLCFLGQRYGWQPTSEDISAETFTDFPRLSEHLGCSVTELEILHALLDPLHKHHVEAAKYAFFFLRQPDYLESITYPPLRAIFTNESEGTREEQALADKNQHRLRQTIAAMKPERPVYQYRATWDTALPTPELLLAKNSDARLTQGRLRDFCAEDNTPLATLITEQLKLAITQRFGERETVASNNPLARELVEQERFLHLVAEGHIPRPLLDERLRQYLEEGAATENLPLYLSAKAGLGKTSLLAHFILNHSPQVVYRFAGISNESSTAERLAASILNELEVPMPDDPRELLLRFSELLSSAAQEKPVVLVIDALDQLVGGLHSCEFLPRTLPRGLKMIVSFRTDSPSADSFAGTLPPEAILRLTGMDQREKLALVDSYLQTYLKKLDEPLVRDLVLMPGTDNPLFLKIILGELRLFGSHDNLAKKLHDEYGDQPVTAFDAVLRRVENDPAYHRLDPRALSEHMFGWLVHSRYGLTKEELAKLLVNAKIAETEEDAKDAVNVLARQLRAFLTTRDQRIGFFYDSFRRACELRYNARKESQQWHGDLVGYFEELLVSHPRRLNELAYQYVGARRLGDYLALLGDYEHHSEQLRQFGVGALLEDCSFIDGGAGDGGKVLQQAAREGARKDAGEAAQNDAAHLYRFYCLAGATLSESPDQLPAQLWGRLLENGNETCDRLIRSARSFMAASGQVWLRPKLPFFDRPGEGPIIRECRQEGYLGGTLDLSPNGKYIVTPTGKQGDGSFLIWDCEKGNVVHRLATGSATTIRASFSPDGRFLVGNHEFCGQRIRVWDATSFQVVADFPQELPFCSTKRGAGSYAEDISFALSPDSKAVAVFDKGISLLDIQNGQTLCDCAYEHAASLFAFGGDVLAVGNLHPDRESARYAHLKPERAHCPLVLFTYDSASGLLRPYRELEGHRGSAQAVCVSKDGRHVASCGDDGSVRLWDTRTGALLREIPADRRGVFDLAFTSQGDRLLVGSMDGSICFYAMPDLRLCRRISCHMGGISSLALNGDGTMCAALSTSFNSLKLYSLTTPEEIDTSSSEQNVSLGKNRVSNLFVASSYPNFIEPGMVPTSGDPCGMISFFDGESNQLLSTAALQSINRTDFPLVSEDGSCVVSKDDALEASAVTFCYWPFDEYPVLQAEFRCAQAFQVTLDKQSQWHSFLPLNHYVHYSTDYRFIVCCERSADTIFVYQTDTGKRIGTVRFKPKKAMITASLNPDAPPYSSDEEISENIFDVSQDGRFLYAFHLSTGTLRTYRVKNGRLKDCVRIKGYLPGFLSVGASGTYYKNRLTVRDNLVFVATDQLVALIDARKGRLLFELDRTKHKEGESYSEDDTYASLHPDGRLLFVTRKIYRNKTYTHKAKVQEWLEVWDTAKNARIASFCSDGKISNIIVEPAQCTFASSNGMLCTLFLENYWP
jgi:WD40 repeat protein